MENLISETPRTTAATIIVLLLAALFLSITPTAQSICSDIMSASLSSSGFTVFAHALHAHNLTTAAAARRLTFLAPLDTALINRLFNNDTLHGHITAAGALPYQSLLALPSNATLPTLNRHTILSVGNDGQRVTFNDALVVVSNLYVDGSCVVHGIDGPLVPMIPSQTTADDSVEGSRMEDSSPSPVAQPVRRRQARQVSSFLRFIRRANHPSHANESSGSESNPP